LLTRELRDLLARFERAFDALVDGESDFGLAILSDALADLEFVVRREEEGA
jgi:hypothetical protein